MKKFVLSAASVFVALTMSAQVPASITKEIVKAPISSTLNIAGTHNISFSTSVNAMKKAPAKVGDVSDLYGEYVWFDQMSDQEEVDQCSPVVISASDAEFTDDNGNSYPTIHMEGLAQGYAEVDAAVVAIDDEGNIGLYVWGDQYCYSHPDYGNMSLHGLYVSEDGNDLMIAGGMLFVFDEDGNLVPEEGCIGWLIYMDDYAEAGNENPYWNMYYNYEGNGEGAGNILRTNGKQGYAAVKGQAQSWGEYYSAVYVKKSLNQIKVYGFADLSVATMTLMSDGTAVLPCFQDMYYLPNSQDPEVYGNSMYIVAVVPGDDGYIHRDYSIEELEGEWSGSTYVNMGDQYWAIASNADENGAAYGYGWFHGYELIFGDDYNTGINNVTVANTSAKTFNLMGQQVKANTKGLVIRDGKKIFVK